MASSIDLSLPHDTHIKNVIENAIGPYPQHCAGYMNPPAGGWGYIAVHVSIFSTNYTKVCI